MKHLYFLAILLLFSSNISLNAQEEFYDTETIQEIRIYFEQDNWDELLDALYVSGEKERLLANLVINGESIDSVGIRYKGFSSVSTDRKKNPFNIKLDYVIDNQKIRWHRQNQIEQCHSRSFLCAGNLVLRHRSKVHACFSCQLRKGVHQR